MTAEREPLLEGTLISHLLELRDRLLRAFIAVIIVFAPCMYYSNRLFEILSKPLREQLPAGGTMIATSVTAPFMIPFKLAFMTALIIAMPYVLFQVWRFVAPGLYRHEKRFALPLLVSAVLLFYAGVAFAYWVVFPLVFHFFVHTAPAGVAVMTDISQYMEFVLVLVLAFGLTFEVPVAVVLLVATNVVPVAKLKEIRGYVLIACFVIGAMFTPPDMFSQTIMAVPMYALYECGILFAQMLARRKAAPAGSS